MPVSLVLLMMVVEERRGGGGGRQGGSGEKIPKKGRKARMVREDREQEKEVKVLYKGREWEQRERER